MKQSIKLKLRHEHASFNILPNISIKANYKVYDAINEDSKLPNIEYPDTDASKAIIEFHACKYQSCA